MSQAAERIIRDWRAAEMFVPRPLPSPDVRENVIDVSSGHPLPWEPGGRLAGRPAGPGKVWRHQVFGGLFALSRVSGAAARLSEAAAPVAGAAAPPVGQNGLSGQSALFYCIVGESGTLITGPAVSECAWAAGQLALGQEAVGDGDPAAWVTASSRDGCLRVAPENLPAFPDGPPAAPDLARFAAELGDLLGVTALLEPDGLRVRSYQVPAYPELDPGAGTDADDPPLSGFFAADLASVAEALRDSAGPALAAFLAAPEDAGRVDVRREPLVVRDGCDPGRMPAAGWPAAVPLMLSERFAVNEILAAPASPLTAVAATPGAATTAVFGDVIAALITERARVLASLPSPESGFGNGQPRGSPAVVPPVPALTGFEILMAASSARADGLAAVGDAWLDQAAATDYFASTARLAGGTETWAMIRAHLGDADTSRAFIDRFWHGTVHGADALFRAGLPMREALSDSPVTAWPAAVARFRSALASVQSLSAERSEVSAAVTRLSSLEQACEDAYSALDDAQARVAELTEREPAARADLVATEERRRARHEDLRAHQDDKPGVAVAVSTGLRAGRDWYTAHRTLRAAFDEAARQRDSALALVQAIRAELAGARKTIAQSQDAATRLGAEMDTLFAPVAMARLRWGDHVPEGPSYAETEDAALIELRESSAPWADPEFSAARAELFFAALALHKSFVCANADVFEANLTAWTEIVCGAQHPPPPVALAAWQSFFLVVPVVSTTFASLGSLLKGLGHGALGWLLADGTDGVPARHVAGALWRARRAVLAGVRSVEEAGSLEACLPEACLPEDGGSVSVSRESAHHFASRVAPFGTSLPDGSWTGLPLYPRRSSAIVVTSEVAGSPRSSGSPGASVVAGGSGVVSPAMPANQGEALQSVLSDLRQRARSRRATRTA